MLSLRIFLSHTGNTPQFCSHTANKFSITILHEGIIAPLVCCQPLVADSLHWTCGGGMLSHQSSCSLSHSRLRCPPDPAPPLTTQTFLHCQTHSATAATPMPLCLEALPPGSGMSACRSSFPAKVCKSITVRLRSHTLLPQVAGWMEVTIHKHNYY